MALIIGSNGFIGSHMRSITEPGLICMAGISSTTCEDESALLEVNVRLPLQLLQDATEANVPFIYASSASVYGNGNGPLNAYARSKATLDGIMTAKGGCWYGLRLFNVYGEGEERKGGQASLPSKWRHGFASDAFLIDYVSRDFVHVGDVVDVARWFLRHRPPAGIYDVGTGQSRKLSELMALLKAQHVGQMTMPDHLRGKYQFHTQADLTKLRAAGYDKPFKSLEEGLALWTA